jgi:hypothetical protein
MSLLTPLIVKRGGPGGDGGALTSLSDASSNGEGVRAIENGTAGHCGTSSSSAIDMAGLTENPDILALRAVAVRCDVVRFLPDAGLPFEAGTESELPGGCPGLMSEIWANLGESLS